MRLLYIVLLLLTYEVGSAQITFNKRFDAGFPFQNVTQILPTDSCYYVIGVFTDTTGGLPTVGSFFDKLNLEGETEWQKTIGGPSKHYETWRAGLISESDSTFLTMGITSDSVNKAIVIRYDINGDTLATKEFINPFYPNETFISAFQAINVLSNGDIIAATGINVGPASNTDIYFLRLDKDLNLIDSYIYADPLQNAPKDIIVIEDENIIVGSIKSNIAQTSNNFIYRSHLLQLDETFDIQWQYSTPTVDLYDFANALLPTPDGGLIVGTGKGVETAINSSSGRVDWNPCFFKLNAARQMEWVREFRGRTMGPIYAIVKIAQATDSSGYLGISRIADFESAEEPLNGMWVMKVSNTGDSLWARHFTLINEEPGMPEPMDLKATPDGGYIVCGAIDPPYDGGVHPLRYGWLLKLDEHGCLVPGCHLSTGTEEEAAPRPALALYPNPARDFINFELRGARPAPDGVFRILDAQGRLLQTIPGREALGTLVVPVHDWAAGAYVVQYLEGGQARAAEQFLKVE